MKSFPLSSSLQGSSCYVQSYMDCFFSLLPLISLLLIFPLFLLSKLMESSLCPSVLKFHDNVPHFRFLCIYCSGYSVNPFNPAIQFVSLFLELILHRLRISWIGFLIFLSFPVPLSFLHVSVSPNGNVPQPFYCFVVFFLNSCNHIASL